MLSQVDIQQAVEFEDHDYPVLSVYLNVDPQQRSVESYRLALRNLLNKADKAAKTDVERIQNYVEMGYNRQGRSLVLFSCAAADFWWARSLQAPMADKAFVSYRPYIRPLATLLDTYERYGVIHVDQEGARLYVFHMGDLESADGYLGEEVKLHRAGGWSAQQYQRQEMQQARQNLQDAAEMAESLYRRTDTRRLILAGTEKTVARFKELLSHRLRSMVVGQINAGATASPATIRDEAQELVQKAADDEAQALTDQVITAAHKGGNAILGLAETLTAVQTGRAQHVVVLADYEQPAYRFVDSGYILLELNEQSELASGKVQSLPDAVDSVLRRALAQGIGVTILDRHPALAAAGKIGALTRY
ncbi:MAG: Vms1/Ankzf1 family peptidyl-tRNA hydrolase [Caldilineaceae bacterium]